MNLAYYSEFKSRYNTPYRVEIYTKKNTGSAKEIRLSGTPFTVEWESDRLYKPLKMSNAVCSIITRELLLDLYTGENQGVEVVLKNRETNTLEWFGFVTPNMYSSDYISLDTLDIEAIDSIACLDNIKYSYMGEKADFRSFSEIICNVLAKADPQKCVQKLYVQNCNKLTSSATACILKSLYIHERNFFDEMNEPMTCKDVLTSLVEYLGMTLIQWKDAYYIIDYEYIDNGYTDCTLFNIRNLTSSNTILPISSKNIMDIGVSSSNGSISLDSVYNKVTVVANTNAIGDLCPDLIDDDDLENQNSDPDKYYTQTIDDTVFLSAYFKSKENWETLQSVEEMDDSNIGNIYYGSFFQKTDSYSINDSEPSSLDWGTYLTFCSKTMGEPWLTSGDKLYTPYLTLKKKNASLLNSGYLIIDFSYKFSQSYIADDGFNSPSGKSVYVSNSSNKYSAGYEDTKFYCRLKIGDYYYNGEEWRLYSEYTNNLDYYKVNLGIESVYGEKKILYT